MSYCIYRVFKRFLKNWLIPWKTVDTMAMSGEAFDFSTSDVDEMFLTVRFDSKTFSIPVRRTTTIGEIKKQFLLANATVTEHETVLPYHCINLLFAGQLLDDKNTVEDYDLGIQTTLHAFCPTSAGADNKYPKTTHKDDRYCRFFVYCKVCESVRPGKLRLCCKLCGSSVFHIKQGPSSWQDITDNTSIQGECQEGNCSSRVPFFYIKCSYPHEPEKPERETTAVTLKHIQANRRKVECIICQEIMSPVLIFPCPPGHVICLPCFKEYALTSMNTRQFTESREHGYTLPCPSGCPESFIEDSHHFYLMGQREYERYKQFGTEEFVLQNGGVLCPAPGCGMGLFPEEDQTRVKCTECQFVSCKLCKREFHFGTCQESLQSELRNNLSLSVYGQRAQRSSWESQSLTLIEDISKPCPHCKVKTQHNGGCMHMVCSRCHGDWCWLCVRPWDRRCQEDHWFG